MKVLVCGADGFLGRHLCASLAAQGHTVLRGVRRPRAADDLAIDYMRDLTPDSWLPRLAGVDAVVNAVGILREGPHRTFAAIHRDAPIALFKACRQAGVECVIQISALGGADEHKLTPYMQTKRDADAFLQQSDLNWSILQPSLVVGANGASSRFFRMLASLPIIGLPGQGGQLLQPVHIDDVCAAVVKLLEPAAPAIHSQQIVAAVGPDKMTYRQMLQVYRDAMQLAAPLWLPIPMPLMHDAAKLAAHIPSSVLSSESLQMLEDGNTADADGFEQVLGHAPRAAALWFAGIEPQMLRAQAISAWALPMLRVALALVWLITGFLSLGIYPVDQSLALLNQVGLTGGAATAALYGSALLDCVFGVATLLAPGRTLWRLQFALIAAYTVIITIYLPAYWLHPFGPVLKNIPILALLLVLDAFEPGKK